MMSPLRWERIQHLFSAARPQKREERARFLKRQCGDDSALYHEVLSLLEIDGKAGLLDDTLSLTGLRGLDIIADRFRIIRHIGKGGMGDVYEAEDLQLRNRVALKTIRPEIASNPKVIRRFKREILLGKRVTHPNVCRIHDLGFTRSAEGTELLFLTMEFLNGETLSSRIKRGMIPEAEAIPLIEDMADALSAAHHADVLHRDFKSANVMLVHSPDRTKAIITDFGLARAFRGSGERTTLTGAGAIAGTVAYMAPEQIKGEETTPATDIYALGVVMYEMITGRRPFTGDSDVSIALKHINDPPNAPSILIPGLNPIWDAVILGCLRKSKNERFSSAAAVKAALHSELPVSIEAKELLLAQGDKGVNRLRLEVRSTAAGDAIMPELPMASRPRPAVLTAVLPFVKNGLTIATLAVTLLLLFTATLMWPSIQQKLGLSPRQHAKPPVRRLVVLPFRNTGDDPLNRALTDGLMEVLTSNLTRIEGFQGALSIVPSSEVRRRKVDTPANALKQFHADLVIEGSVRRDAAGVRLSIDLIDPFDVRQLGGAVFIEQSSALNVIEASAVEKLSQLLEINIRPEAKKAVSSASPNVPAAYDSFLQGIGLLPRRGDDPDNLEKAIILFQQAIKTDPSFALAYAKLGESYLMKYRHNKDPELLGQARDYSNRALSLNDQLPSAFITLGSLSAASGQHELALQQFQRAIRLDETNPEAYQGLGGAYETLGRPKDAEAMLQRALDLAPDSWEAYSWLGSFYFKQARYSDAVAQFRRLLGVAPDNFIGYLNLGAALVEIDQLQEAATMLKRSIDIAPSYAGYANLGTIHYRGGRYSDAASMYEKALAINENDYNVWVNLAICYKRLNVPAAKKKLAYQKAALITEQFLKAKSQDSEAICALAAMKVELGQKGEAEKLARKAILLAPMNPRVESAAASVFELIGSRDTALDLISKAFRHGLKKDLVTNDPDFSNLVNDSRFGMVLANIQRDQLHK